MSLDEHLFARRRKSVLALDGGGVRGIVTLAFLERIESLLREHYGTGEAFRLRDHFSLVGGTSTGSIIATGLALGFRVRELIQIYRELSLSTFGRSRWLGGLLVSKFSFRPLVEAVRSQIGDKSLGAPEVGCGLAIISKRLDSNSVWIFHNHPQGIYFSSQQDQPDFTPNCDIPLIDLIRASTAAPTYFDPKFIEIAPSISGTFIDGGVSPHNNPAFALFMLATIGNYGFNWPTGADHLHIVSVGTGQIQPHKGDKNFGKNSAATLAYSAMRSMALGSNAHVQLLMQWLGRARMQLPEVDREIGDLAGHYPGGLPLFDYCRYDIRLEREWLARNLGAELDNDVIEQLSRLDNAAGIPKLLELARSAAETQVLLPDILPSDSQEK